MDSDDFGNDDMDLLGEDDILQDLLDSLVKEPGAYLNIKDEPGLGKEGKKGGQPSKKRKFNPDAEKIAAVTEEALRQLDIDPSSQDAKKKRRQIRNRLSAQFHRDRKNAYIKNLEETNESKDKQIQLLQEQIRNLESHNTFLKDQLYYYQSGSSSSSVPSGNTTVAQSDSESSMCHTPLASESPFSEPQENTSLPSLRELVPSRVNSSIPLPIVKTLSLLSVLCIICMGSLNYMDEFSTSISRASYSSEMAARSSSGSQYNHRRKLLQDDRTPTFDELFALPPVNESASSASASFFPTQSLRGTAPDQRNLTLNESVLPRMVLHSRDLMPFELYESGKDWYFSDDRYHSPNSKIVMNTGVALFNPAMKFNSRLSSPTLQGKQGNQDLAVVPAQAYHQHQQQQQQKMIQSLPEPKFIPVVKVEKDAIKNDHQNPNWPALPTTNQPAVIYPADTATEVDCSRCPGMPHQDENYLLGKFLSQANHVTVTVPATSVKMGKTVQDSEDSTMEGLMEMFNLSLDDERNHSVSKSVLRDSLNDASVEINCIILGAKLIMNHPKQH